MPILYKVCHDLTKGIQEFEVISINNDNTFTYKNHYKRIIKRKFESQHGNDSIYFINRVNAQNYLIDKINASIEFHTKAINKAKSLLKSIQDGKSN